MSTITQLIEFAYKGRSYDAVSLMRDIVTTSAIGQYNRLEPVVIVRASGRLTGCYKYQIANVIFLIQSKKIYGETSRYMETELLPKAKLALTVTAAPINECEISRRVLNTLEREISSQKINVAAAPDYWSTDSVNGFIIDDSLIMLITRNGQCKVSRAYIKSTHTDIVIGNTHKIDEESFFELINQLPGDIITELFKQTYPSGALRRVTTAQSIKLYYIDNKTEKHEHVDLPVVGVLTYCKLQQSIINNEIHYHSAVSPTVIWVVKRLITKGELDRQLLPTLTVAEIKQFYQLVTYLGISY